jgi:predicted amidohydrolase YtcJ
VPQGVRQPARVRAEASPSASALIRDAHVGAARVDVRLRAGAIAEIGPRLRAAPNELAIDARGGALIPGLHDHHLHLLAQAAAAQSIACGPPQVEDEAALRRALVGAPGRGWLRGTGYHESVAGPLDRSRLDTWLPARPVRIQHRTGVAWMLNSAALAELGSLAGVEGVERDPAGHPTGRLFRADRLLRQRLASAPPDLAALGAQLAARGVTGVSDASAHNGAEELALIASASQSGALPQRVQLLGSETLPEPTRTPRLTRGPLKVLLDDRDLPDPARLAQRLAAAHAAGRACAIHCVTRAELLVALAALEDAGARPGDRIEHASIAPPEALPRIAALGATVVTQPGFVFERGDDYLRDVDSADSPWLYRLRAFDDAGIPLAGGTDAPYAALDPWLAMRAAVERRTRAGSALGASEAVSPERALALFSGALADPGGQPREIAIGAAADLCLLHVPWSEARSQLSSELVAATWIGGELAWRSPQLRS